MATVPAELELAQIPRQVLVADVVEGVHQASLEKRVIAFCEVDVDQASNVLAGVVDRLVAAVELVKIEVGAMAVGDDMGVRVDVAPDQPCHWGFANLRY